MQAKIGARFSGREEPPVASMSDYFKPKVIRFLLRIGWFEFLGWLGYRLLRLGGRIQALGFSVSYRAAFPGGCIVRTSVTEHQQRGKKS